MYQTFLFYLRTKISRVQFIMLVATLTGLASGLVAVALKTLVHYLQAWAGNIPGPRMIYYFLPVVGLLLTVFIIHRFFKGILERGIAMVLKSIARKQSFIPVKDTYLHAITSAVTVGLGGSAGLEAPIVATGSAVGSNLARISELNYQERTLLIACGAAAGIAAVFNAPIAGVIFAIEVLLSETIVSYFIPLIISSVIGALCSRIILNENVLFNFKLAETFNYNNTIYYIVLGVLAGLVSLYYARLFKLSERVIHGWKLNAYAKAILAGLMLALIYFLFFPLFGEGYESVKIVASGDPRPLTENIHLLKFFGTGNGLLLFCALIVMLKPIAAGITIGGGGNGGNFAPSLFTGAFLGFFFSRLLNQLPWVKISEGNFSLVGMAGVLSGVMYCPLTAIFLIAEITNGYGLFIPLMIVSAISFFFVKSYEAFSMETKKLALEGNMFTHKKEKNILTTLTIKDILDTNYQPVKVQQSLQDLVEQIRQSDHTIFPVVDQKDHFVGVIELNDIKHKLFDRDKYSSVPLSSLVKKPAAILKITDDMHTVMEYFDKTTNWHLPVINQQQHFAGFVSQQRLFDRYRKSLAQQNDLYEDEEIR